MSIPHVKPDSPIEDLIAALESAGELIVDRLVSAEFMDTVAAGLRPWIEPTPAGSDEFFRTAHAPHRRAGRAISRLPRVGDESHGARFGETIPAARLQHSAHIDDLRDPMETVRPDLARRGFAA